jgi:hypothetical protein
VLAGLLVASLHPWGGIELLVMVRAALLVYVALGSASRDAALEGVSLPLSILAVPPHGASVDDFFDGRSDRAGARQLLWRGRSAS